MRLFRPALLCWPLCLLALCAGGCASSVPVLAVMDVLNVAETGKTGYDMLAGLNSRRSLDLDESPDAQAEARLRSILNAQGGALKRAVPHVSQGRGYVVGSYSDPRDPERMRQAMASVKGVQELTLCLIPEGSGQPGRMSDSALRDAIIRSSGLRTRDVRVHVVEGTAVLTGTARSRAEQQHLLDTARSAGATNVRNLLRLAEIRSVAARQP